MKGITTQDPATTPSPPMSKPVTCMGMVLRITTLAFLYLSIIALGLVIANAKGKLGKPLTANGFGGIILSILVVIGSVAIINIKHHAFIWGEKPKADS